MKDKSLFYLILVNIIPLIGVLFFDWSLYQIMFVFWFENIVIGFYNLLKMNKTAKYQRSKVELKKQAQGALFFKIFFLVHFGFFTAGHGIFVNVIFNDGTLIFWSTLILITSLFISHGFSYQNNFLKKQEYKKLSVQKLFLAPYKRVVIMHLIIIFGGWAVLLIGQPIGALLILIILKIVIDSAIHKKVHINLINKKVCLIKEK